MKGYPMPQACWNESRGTFLTNFDKPERAKYQAAIDAYRDPNLVIQDEPWLPPNARSNSQQWLRDKCHSLHYMGARCDLSRFWRIFRGEESV